MLTRVLRSRVFADVLRHFADAPFCTPVETSAKGRGGMFADGGENAEERGVTKFYDRGTDHPNAKVWRLQRLPPTVARQPTAWSIEGVACSSSQHCSRLQSAPTACRRDFISSQN